MKILTCCYEYPPVGGGGAKVVQGLTDELASRGHAVDVITMGFKTLPLYEHRGKVVLYRIPGIRRKRFVCSIVEMIPYAARALPTALRLVRSRQYDVNHTHFIFPDGVIAWQLFARTGLPYIVTVHGSDVPGYNPHRFTAAHRLLLPLWKRIVLNARCIVCPSRTLERLVKDTLPEAQTVVIPNGFDPSRFKPDTAKKKTILCVTRMLERKGVQYLIRALQGMDLHDTEVHIVGDGPYLPAVRRLAEECGVKAVFHGFIDNNAPGLKVLLEEAGIFVFVSESENFPNVLLEAMAAGAAIVTTRGTGCEEVTHDTAVLVHPRSADGIRAAVTRLLSDDRLRQRLSQAGRRRIEDLFTWDKVAAAYEDQYRRSACRGNRTA